MYLNPSNPILLHQNCDFGWEKKALIIYKVKMTRVEI